MTSQKKIEACRSNARRSTGPRSYRGKLVARFNALTLGHYAKLRLLPGESPEASLENWINTWADCMPVGPREESVFELIVDAKWRLQRLKKGEDVALERATCAIISNDLRVGNCLEAASDGAIDFMLLRRLRVTEPSETAKDSPQESPDDVDLKVWATHPIVTMHKPPPVGMAVMKAFSSSNSRAPGLEIEALIRKITKHLFALYDELNAMQERRIQHAGPSDSVE